MMVGLILTIVLVEEELVVTDSVDLADEGNRSAHVFCHVVGSDEWMWLTMNLLHFFGHLSVVFCSSQV